MLLPRRLRSRRLLRVGFAISAFCHRFRYTRSWLMAAALAYYGFLAAVPALLLTASVLAPVLRTVSAHSPADLGDEAQVAQEALSGLLPGAAGEARETLLGVLAGARGGLVGGLSALALVWLGIGAFDAAEIVLNSVWETYRDRRLWARKLVSVLMLACAALLLLVSCVLTAFLRWPGGGWSVLGVSVHDLSALLRHTAGLVPFVLSLMTFWLAYTVLPATNVDRLGAAAGALVAAVLWELSKVGFAQIVGRSGSYGSVYGPLAATVTVLVWFYVSAISLVTGAQVAVMVQRARAGEDLRHRWEQHLAGASDLPVDAAGSGARRRLLRRPRHRRAWQWSLRWGSKVRGAGHCPRRQGVRTTARRPAR